jgi:hypothetical protein
VADGHQRQKTSVAVGALVWSDATLSRQAQSGNPLPRGGQVPACVAYIVALSPDYRGWTSRATARRALCGTEALTGGQAEIKQLRCAA